MKNIQYIGVPVWQGNVVKGVETAPSVLLKSIERQEDNNAFINYNILPELVTTETDNHSGLYHVISVYLSNILMKSVLTCHEQQKTPIIIGGDHSIGLGSVAASLEIDANVGLIWFDAHGDMNTEATSPTGHIHGMPIAALLGLCKSELNKVATKNIRPENIFFVGTRSLDDGELELTRALPFNVYSTEYIHKVGMTSVTKQIYKKISENGIKNIHCSFDVDAMDPSIVGATGVPVGNGLFNNDFQEFTNFLKFIKQQIIAFDFVEFNPLLDNPEQDSLKWCKSALMELQNIIYKQ